ADDLIIFRKADENQARLLKGILKDFYNFSGHWVYAGKSNIFFSKGVSEESWKILCDILDFNRGHTCSVCVVNDTKLLHAIDEDTERCVGICLVLDSKLWGILEGLTITMDRGFDRVLIVSNSQEVVQAIQGSATK
ncbi:hypothetical protein Gorai_019702, partial [Gossypium raimondii]|nr:hypothetical protein [Gossypium raimondii]